MVEYIFIDNYTGEPFSVCDVETLADAQEIADQFFADAEFVRTASSAEIEMMGLDTY